MYTVVKKKKKREMKKCNYEKPEINKFSDTLVGTMALSACEIAVVKSAIPVIYAFFSGIPVVYRGMSARHTLLAVSVVKVNATLLAAIRRPVPANSHKAHIHLPRRMSPLLRPHVHAQHRYWPRAWRR